MGKLRHGLVKKSLQGHRANAQQNQRLTKESGSGSRALHHENTLPHPSPVFLDIIPLDTWNKAVGTTPCFRTPSLTSSLCLSLCFLPPGWIWDSCEDFPAWLSQSRCEQVRQWLVPWMCPQRPHGKGTALQEPAPEHPWTSVLSDPFLKVPKHFF